MKISNDLYVKVLSKDYEGLEQLLSGRTLSLEDFNYKGKQLLTIAIEKGDFKTLKVLLDSGAPTDECSRDEYTGRCELPLSTAIRLNKKDMVTELLRRNRVTSPAIGLECLQERRYNILNHLLENGMGYRFLEYILQEPIRGGMQIFLKSLSSCLHLLLSCDARLQSRYTVTQIGKVRRGVPTNIYGAILLQEGGAAIRNLDLKKSNLAPILSLKSHARIAVRETLKKNKTFIAVEQIYRKDPSKLIKLTRLPKSLLNYLFFEREILTYKQNIWNSKNCYELIW